MPRATKHLHDRLAVVFDFDLTLAPGTFEALLHRCGEDPEDWKRRRLQPLLEQGWEEVLAKVYGLVALSRAGSVPITRSILREVGRTLEPFDGVPAMFDRLRDAAQEVVPELRVEFYLLSSGLLDIMEAAAIAGRFEALWGTRLHFDEETGAVDFPMLVVTHPEKVRYLLALCKGLPPTGSNAPAHVFQDVPEHEWHVPLDQVVYVGDGSSDMAVFRLLGDRGGLAIGVFKGDGEAADWRGMDRIDRQRRVQNLAPADYSEGSELLRSLTLAVDSIARKIALRRLGRGE